MGAEKDSTIEHWLRAVFRYAALTINQVRFGCDCKPNCFECDEKAATQTNIRLTSIHRRQPVELVITCPQLHYK